MGICGSKATDQSPLVSTEKNVEVVDEAAAFANVMLLSDLFMCNEGDLTGRWTKCNENVLNFWKRNDLPESLKSIKQKLFKHASVWTNFTIRSAHDVGRFYRAYKEQIDAIIYDFENGVKGSEDWYDELKEDQVFRIWVAALYCAKAVSLLYATDMVFDETLDSSAVADAHEIVNTYFDQGLQYYDLCKIRIEKCYALFDSYSLTKQDAQSKIESMLSQVKENPQLLSSAEYHDMVQSHVAKIRDIVAGADHNHEISFKPDTCVIL